MWILGSAGSRAPCHCPPPRSPIGSNASPVSLAQGVHAMPSLCARPVQPADGPMGTAKREDLAGGQSDRSSCRCGVCAVSAS